MRGLPILTALEQVKNLANDKIRKHKHPLPYDYVYTELLNKEEIDLTSGFLIKGTANPQAEFTKIHKEDSADYIPIFTDGSKILEKESSRVGCAIYLPNSKQGFKYTLDELSSIYTAEALAIFLAIDIIRDQGYSKSVIYTDSKSVLEALHHYSPQHKNTPSHLILDIKSAIYRLKKKNQQVKLTWIPAHEGIEENEMVDTLAKEATKQGIQVYMKLNYSEFEETLSKIIKKINNEIVTSEGKYKGIKYFNNFYKETDSKPWFSKVTTSRYHITTLNRIRANHYSLGESILKKNLIQSASCPCGTDIQDIDHIVFECPLY